MHETQDRDKAYKETEQRANNRPTAGEEGGEKELLRNRKKKVRWKSCPCSTQIVIDFSVSDFLHQHGSR